MSSGNEPAFPYEPRTMWGMTLRDYFAAKAMQAIIADTTSICSSVELVASLAYQYADAMIKVRESK